MGLTMNHVAAVSVPVTAGYLWATLGYHTIFWAGLGLAVVGLPVTAPLTIAADETIVSDATQTAIGRSIETVMGLAQRRGAALGVVDSTSAATLFPAWRRALVGRDEISLVPATALVEE